jgi:hypothetical protein
MMRPLQFTIIDDTGLIALIDPDAYVPFVKEDWQFDELETRFLEQMAEKHMLIWETSMEGIWRVDVYLGRAAVVGVRELSGPIIATQGRLLLTSFSSLSMAAQYADVLLPQSHEADQLIQVPAGEYRCRIVQSAPSGSRLLRGQARARPDFVVEIVSEPNEVPVWREIGWVDLFRDEP